MEFQLDEKRSAEILIQVLEQSGLNFRLKSPGEDGGFFYFENGERKKFTENIFVKRSIKAEAANLISINEFCEDGNEHEVDTAEMSDNLNVILEAAVFEDELYDLVKFLDLNDSSYFLSDFNLSSPTDDAA